jgi:hypothetical protein
LDLSNNLVLLKTIQPKVAVFNNGPRKGANPEVMANLRRLPDPPVIFQLHRNETVGPAENTDPELIANPSEKDDKGESIVVKVAARGAGYTVTVGSHGVTKTFATRIRE